MGAVLKTVVVETNRLETLQGLRRSFINAFQFRRIGDGERIFGKIMLMTQLGKEFENYDLKNFEGVFNAAKTWGKNEVPTLDMYLFSIKQAANLIRPNEFGIIPKEIVKEVMSNLPLDDKQKNDLLNKLVEASEMVFSKNEDGNLIALSEDPFIKRLVNFINAIEVNDNNIKIGLAGSAYYRIPLVSPLTQLLDFTPSGTDVENPKGEKLNPTGRTNCG